MDIIIERPANRAVEHVMVQNRETAHKWDFGDGLRLFEGRTVAIGELLAISVAGLVQAPTIEAITGLDRNVLLSNTEAISVASGLGLACAKDRKIY
jgi:hypothetical protein